MTDHPYNRHELSQLASSPSTDWETLHWIAEHYPEHRPEIAANPNTYPELLDALADLGEPDIDAALASRQEETAGGPARVQNEGYAEHELSEEHAFQPDDSDLRYSGSDYDDSSYGESSYRESVYSDSNYGESTYSESTYSESTYSQEDGLYPRDYHSEDLDAYEEDGEEEERGGATKAAAILLAVALPVIILGAAAALIWSFLAASDQQDADSGATADPSGPAEPGGDVADNTEQVPQLSRDEALAAIQDLPTRSSCQDPEADAETFLIYAHSVSGDGFWEQSEDGWVVEDTLEGLQDECTNVYAATVYQELSYAEEVPGALAETLEDMGVNWLSFAYQVDDAVEMSEFTSPDGNVICEIGEELRCRVAEHTFDTPAGCEDGAVYAIRVDQGPTEDCEGPAPDGNYEALEHGITAQDGVFACSSFEAQMSCWNQLTGEGINLSESRNSIY